MTPCTYMFGIVKQTMYRLYLNVTLIAHPLCSPPTCQAPAAIEDCGYPDPALTNGCATPCNPSVNAYWPCACPGGTVSFPGIAGWPGNNCYAATTGNFSPAPCNKIGFKNVQAFKAWQGAPGFLDDCPDAVAYGGGYNPACNYESQQLTAPSVRYLTAACAVSLTTCSGNTANYTNCGAEFNQTATVNRYSGQVTFSGCVNTGSSSGKSGGVPFTDSGSSGLCGYNLPGFSVPGACCGTGAGCTYNFSGAVAGDGSDGNPTSPDGNAGTLTIAVTETTYTLNYTATPYMGAPCNSGGGPQPQYAGASYNFTLSVSVTLSNPYTSDEVESDCEALLAYWDLTNDDQYPWRTDTAVSMAPLVTCDETVNNPMNFIGYACATIGTNTGAVLGRPTPPGYAAFWDGAHQNYVEGYEGDPFAWVVETWGAYSPSWCPQATQWTNAWFATALYGGAYSGIGGQNSGLGGAVTPTFPFTIIASSMSVPYSIYQMGSFKQKWCETLLFAKRAHNWARPCGSWMPYDLLGSTPPTPVNDRAARDQTSINCSTNTKGNLRWPMAPCDCDTATNNPGPEYPTDCPPPIGATPNVWNTSQMKNDFVTRVFSYNARDVGEYTRLAAYAAFDTGLGCASIPSVPAQPRGGSPLANLVCTQQNATNTKCPPYVVCISPNGEKFANGITLPMPHVGLDWDYGSFWFCDVQQWMVDPLYQPPHTPDCSGRNWVQDNGTCQPCVTSGTLTKCYYVPPFEECRSVLPAGAPALPPGITLGVQNATSGTPAGPLSAPPVLGGTGTLCCWSFWLNQVATNCSIGM